MPLKIEDKFEAERKKAEAAHARYAQSAVFGSNIVNYLQPQFENPLKCEFCYKGQHVEYIIYLYPGKKGFFSRLQPPKFVLQLVDYRDVPKMIRQNEFTLVVKDPALREVGERLAAWLTLVFQAENIKLHVTDEFISF